MHRFTLAGLVLALTLFSPACFLDLSESVDLSMETMDLATLHDRVKEMLEMFKDTKIDDWKRNRETTSLTFDVSKRAPSNKMDDLKYALKAKSLQARIQTTISNLNKTISHGKTAVKGFQSQIKETKKAYADQTRSDLKGLKNKVYNTVDEAKKSGRYQEDIGLVDCIKIEIEILDNMLEYALTGIEVCTTNAIASVEDNIETLVCQLNAAVDALECSLADLETCNYIQDYGDLCDCLDAVLHSLEFAVFTLLKEIVSLLIQIGTLIGGLPGCLAACSNPIIYNATTAVSAIISNIIGCLSNMF